MRHASATAFLQQPLKRGHAWGELHYAYDYETEDAMYLGWFDDSKKTPAEKIGDAIAAYQSRYSIAPNVVLVNEADRVEHPSISIRVETYIRRNNFWVGYEGHA